jgi:predicted ATPase
MTTSKGCDMGDIFNAWRNTDGIVAFCGAGGTGKTTLMNAVIDRLRDSPLGKDIIIASSIVRAFYAERGSAYGIATHMDWHKMPLDKQMAFQLELLDAYVENVKRVVRDNPGKKIFMDRSLYDHVAYLLAQGSVTRDIYTHINEKQTAYAKNLSALIYLDYPTPYTDSGATEDGFRDTTFGPNIRLSKIMHALVKESRSYTWGKGLSCVCMTMHAHLSLPERIDKVVSGLAF